MISRRCVTCSTSWPTPAQKTAPERRPLRTPSAPPVVKQPPSVASTAPESVNSPAFELGLAHGRANKRSIRHMLRRYADLASPEVDSTSSTAGEQLTADELEIVRGIAAGVQVPVDTIAAHALELLGDVGVASKRRPARRGPGEPGDRSCPARATTWAKRRTSRRTASISASWRCRWSTARRCRMERRGLDRRRQPAQRRARAAAFRRRGQGLPVESS